MNIIKRAITGVVLTGAATVAVIGIAAPANATPMPDVCSSIYGHLMAGDGYEGYLTEAYVMGRVFGYSPRQQARNIVESVYAYCPAYAPGIQAAAQSLSA